VEDSGEGFDYSGKLEHIDEALGDEKDDSSNRYCGRGMGLVRQLVKSIEYQGRGNIVNIDYEWFHLSEQEKQAKPS
jgi:hypothetical protein